MYESPINVIMGELQTQYDNEILKAVQKYDVHVDKEELIKALKNDRNQYEKGYKEGKEEVYKKCVNTLASQMLTLFPNSDFYYWTRHFDELLREKALNE